ncbi:Exosome complex component rrp4-like protein [Elsinoe fawcettii]|nr:Exosome complex component rrp4-like protein [Elsinoe fawcettii]
MPISILPPAPPPALPTSSHSEEDEMDLDSDLPPTSLLTPGQTLTTSPTFMRGHGTYLPSTHLSAAPSTSNAPTSSAAGEDFAILSSLLGVPQRTNRLLSILPLRSSYTPEIGDLIIGRIVEVQSRRFKVHISAPLLGNLPLSSINLPGGILRKRTAVDELNMRNFFEEGDVLVAEVQTLFGDGSAGLHTRSLRYGKLRNGVVVEVGGARGTGVKRGRRQVFDLQTERGEVQVVVGVNGVVHVGVKGLEQGREGTGVGERGELSEGVGARMYSCQNDEVETGLRREIARVVGVVRALVDAGVRVEEEVIRKGYEAAVELEGLEGEAWLGGERGRVVVEMAVAGG